jgi:hypothetical protein
MVKSRGKVIRTQNKKVPQGPVLLVGMPDIELGSWRPADDKPPEQVHMLLHLGADLPSIVVRFKSPDTLGFLIEELHRYRKEVWPDAEPVLDQPPQEDNP